jgi:hypothetical protein
MKNSSSPSSGIVDRSAWVAVLLRLAEPVLVHLSEGRLKQVMPVEAARDAADDRGKYTQLEAFGRLMAGIAPWLEVELASGEEAELQRKYRGLAQQALRSAVDPASPDFMNFKQGQQCLVDAAFLAQAIVRAPGVLWEQLDRETRGYLINALSATRTIRPFFNNWLLFSGMVEAALCQMGAEWDQMRVDYALRQMDQWYKGDGAYGDGPEFHWDYYNSFVIHPMMIDILRVVNAFKPAFESFYVSRVSPGWEDLYAREIVRAQRYAEVQERMISPEGTFPPLGRSLAYRFGAFHLLGQMALLQQLPERLSPAQVRCALTAVIERMIAAPGTFDEHGWLTIGFCGHQPGIGEYYISTGSLYLCTVGLLPLGLPPEDPFWQSPAEDWTSKKAWSGQDLPVDHALI